MLSTAGTGPRTDVLFARHAVRDDCVTTKKGFYGVLLVYFFTPFCNRSNFTFLPFNPSNPNIKIQILICYPYTFSIEVVGRICWSIN